LIGRDGEIIKRYGSMTKPEKIDKDIQEQLWLLLTVPKIISKKKY
jgi:hypothetical protein